MTSSFLQNAVGYLKGVGPKRAEILKKEFNIETFGDLLTYYPFRYVDRTRFTKISEIRDDQQYVQLRGHFVNIQLIGERKGRRLSAVFADQTGTIEVIWFAGIHWVKDIIIPGAEFILFGKPNLFNGNLNFSHPEIEKVTPESSVKPLIFSPVYNTTEKSKAAGFDSRGMMKLVKTLLATAPKIPETFPDDLRESFKLVPLDTALRDIHFPNSQAALDKATFRLKFEELFFIQMDLIGAKMSRKENVRGFHFNIVGNYFNTLYKECLPFALTEAQKRVLREIRKDVGSGFQMNRLLQGDVGSGKTIVALMTMLMALDNGFQACLMAPTEILAVQHFRSLTALSGKLNIRIELLTGSTKIKKRREIFSGLQDGSVHILVGTHALMEDTVQFSNLGLVVIDEQHRFGVEQRSILWNKNSSVPHVLVMTATPIPRTLAMALYGDLDISVIDELPPGRTPASTAHRFDSDRLRLFGFMRQQIEEGRQIYIVYPLIQESEKMDYKDLMDGYESITRSFPKPQYQISIVHGKMKAEDKDFEMERFRNKQTQIMVATSVIEVGVDIPNASVMIIESAERFGLSQLHQLRGRVGRGASQSFCILMSSKKLSDEAKTRIETMVSSTDGFVIAEVDMKLRGPGDLMGTKQSGIMELKLADLTKDQAVLDLARKAATLVLNEDPHLTLQKNRCLVELMKSKKGHESKWSRIS